MRLLIYLLAMLTGFTAADAARPVSATPAELGSAALSVAIIVAAKADSEQLSSFPARSIPSLAAMATADISARQPLVRPAPVERSDRSRE